MFFEVVFGIIIGLVAAYFVFQMFLRKQIRAECELEFQNRIPLIRRETLEHSRATLKGRISEQLAVLLPGFDYEAADARFIGNPIDFIIFDKYTENSEKKGDSRIKIIFMDVKKGTKAKLSKIQEKIKDAVEDKRIEWKTLVLKDETDLKEEESKHIDAVLEEFDNK